MTPADEPASHGSDAKRSWENAAVRLGGSEGSKRGGASGSGA